MFELPPAREDRTTTRYRSTGTGAGTGPVPGPEPEPVVTRGVVVVNALFTVTAEFKFQITVPPAALYSKHPWWLRIDQAKCSNLT